MDGLLEGKTADLRELLVSVGEAGKVEKVERAGNAGVWWKEPCCLMDG